MAYLFSLLLLIAPLYVWRFSVGGLPTNFLMLANAVVIAVGLIIVIRERKWLAVKESLISLGRPMLAVIVLFGLASIISLIAFSVNPEKIAQWTVLYAQPLVLFALFRYNIQSEPRALEYFKTTAYVVVGAAGILALVQYFTLATLPQEWWGNAAEPKRAIAFFAHANAFGLYVTPLLAWLIPDVVQKMRFEMRFADNVDFSKQLAQYKKYIYVGAGLVGAAGLFLSLSRGAWLGLALAVGVYVLISANKRLIVSFAIIGVLLAGVVAVTPNLRYRVLLPFQGEKSTVARFSLWDTGKKMISDSPILGKGVNGFSDNWEKYNTDPNLQHYNFPHNIVLNFWVDLGLLGVISMMALLVIAVVRGIAHRTNPHALALALFVIAIVAHGLIDIPYFKNDLALVFWLIMAASYNQKELLS